MRREDLTLDVRNVDWVDEGDDPARPTVIIDGEDDAADAIRERLSGPGGEDDALGADHTDVAFRLLTRLDDDATGVVSVTDRVTGDFILELNEDAADVLRFIRAARRYGERTDGDGKYRVVIRAEGEEVATHEKDTFLFYNDEGDLLREHSLIPGGVEL